MSLVTHESAYVTKTESRVDWKRIPTFTRNISFKERKNKKRVVLVFKMCNANEAVHPGSC